MTNFVNLVNRLLCVKINVGDLAPLGLEITENFLGDLNISIILEAKSMQKDHDYGALFNASFIVVPQDRGSYRVSVINSTHIELIVTYNTYYNVSATGSACGQTTESPTIQLHYSEVYN